MVGEAIGHEASLPAGSENGLRVLRHLRHSRETFSQEWAMSEKISLDSFDRQILDCLQTDADLPLAEVAKKVGLSTTPCWRRINRLQEKGVIKARVALLDRKAVNAGVTVFVAVRTAQHSAQWLARFAKAVATFPEVMDCYRMSGEIDYLIRLALPDIEAYDAFYKRLIARIELSDVTSMFAMEEIKSTTRLPLNYLP
jgi:Lrp/AsnC family transcriptional regulator